jgi:hypothetical protein
MSVEDMGETVNRPYATKPKYVYMYKDKDGVPYYVGQGSTARALSWQKKPFSWEHIPPYNGNTLHFVECDLTNKEADELEIFLISEIGRKDLDEGTLLNRTDGGPGRKRYTVTEDEKKKQSETKKMMHKSGAYDESHVKRRATWKQRRLNTSTTNLL